MFLNGLLRTLCVELHSQFLLVLAVVGLQSAGISKVQQLSLVLDAHGQVVQRANLGALVGQGVSGSGGKGNSQDYLSEGSETR